MSWQALLVLATFASTIAALIRYQHNPTKIFGGVILFLYLSNLVSTEQLIDSVANPGLLTLVLLMLCSIALEKTRLLRLLASSIIKPSLKETWLRLYSVTVLASAALNNTAVVATLLAPIRNNPNHNPSKLLLPLSYAAILGGTLTLIGTSTNLIVNSLLIDTSGESLGFFDFTIIGLVAVIACGVTLAFSSRFLPNHEMEKIDFHSYFIDAKVQAESGLIGRSVEDNGLRHLESLFLVEIVRRNKLISPVAPDEILEEGDRLVFSGDITKLMQLSQFSGLKMFADSNGLLGSNLTEVVIRPESVLNGKTLKGAGFRAQFDAAVVAIRRDGHRISGKLGDVVLQAGDFLVLAVGSDYKNRNNLSKNFILVSGVEAESRLSGLKEWVSIGGFFGAVALAAIGIVPLFKVMFLLLGLLLFTGCLTPSEILRRFPKEIWLIVAAALTLSQALHNSGLVGLLESAFGHISDPSFILVSLFVIYLLTWLLTELVTNNAAAALMFPIAYGFALAVDANPMAFTMIVAFGASASFVSPYGYQTNLMVYNAGRYRLVDFVKVGFPVALVYALVVLTLVPIMFPLK
ncbi:SLC13 family permease [Agarivorans aestuarii]|uniref:SLC13 family permease n=1 Tax=Agarivorans aestuarii TaxID=1563703 RepID=A0ABU7G090_9ALTE|nr:SLC13 family permease [Agarivorans aestuarii]MEE1672823.1 SLC13 family permease [Agarivorans aestuarii]